MSKRAWTDGPWRISRGAVAHVESKNDRGIASCGGYSTNADNGEHRTENEANARLIAAAPALYEALENARRSMIVSVTGISDGLTIHDIRSWIEQADGALAAANPKPGA